MREHGCRWALTPSVVRECGTLYGEAIADAISWAANVQRSLWNSSAGSTTLCMVGVDKPSPAGLFHPRLVLRRTSMKMGCFRAHSVLYHDIIAGVCQVAGRDL